jgi:hypothetical protein
MDRSTRQKKVYKGFLKEVEQARKSINVLYASGAITLWDLEFADQLMGKARYLVIKGFNRSR